MRCWKGKKKMVKIEYTKWGLANRFDDCIELNIALKKNSKMHAAILDHELGHKEKNTFKQDLAHDLRPINEVSQWEILLFMIKNPRTFTQILPFYWSPKRKEFIYDLNMVIIYTVIFGGIGLLLKFI